MKTKVNKKNNTLKRKFLKIIYFDEGSALDYIDVMNEGHIYNEIVTTFENNDASESKIEANVSIGVKILNLFKASSSIQANSSVGIMENEILKSTLNNTILTDFIKFSNDDHHIIKYHNQVVKPLQNSITNFKCYAPYLMLIKDSQIEGLNLSVFNDVLEKAKGYYELLIEENNEKSILRFNIKAFKNNYCLNDLTKMMLSYYCIEVGETQIDKLDMSNEFGTKDNYNNISAKDVLDQNGSIDDVVRIYDVILAGVSIDDK